MFKKICGIFLSVTMLLTATSVVCGAENNTAAENRAFKRLQEMSILQGYEDGSYKVENLITRAEFFSVLNKVSKVTRNDGLSFSDVDEGQWYKEAIELAVSAGYASGYGDGTFRPEANITRAEAAAAMCKAFGGDIEKMYNFTDRDSVPEWAVEYVDIMTSGGYLTAYSDGSFKGSAYITRGEVAVMLDRFIGEIYAEKADVENKTYNQNLIIGVTGVTFKNTVFEGDVFIGAGVSGEIKFVDCKIAGTVHMAGRDGAIAFFENTDCKKVCVNSTGTANVITSGSSVIDVLVTRSECGITELNADKGIKTVTAYSDAELFGTFENVIEENSAKVKKVGSSNIKRSYTLAKYYSGDFKSDPIVGGSRTELQTDRKYLLDSLTTSGGRLIPAFSPEVTEYTLAVPASMDSVKIQPIIGGNSECRVLGKNVNDGYNTEIIPDTNKAVDIDVYSELIKRNTYSVTVMPYSEDNTGILNMSIKNKKYRSVVSSDGSEYILYIMGADLGGVLPVTVNVETIDPDATVKIDGTASKSKELEITAMTLTVPVKVISSNGKTEQEYSLTIVRDEMPATDFVTTVTNNGASAVYAVSVNYTATETASAGEIMTLTVADDVYTHTLPALTKGTVLTEVFYVRMYPGENQITVDANDAFTVTGVAAESKTVATYQAETDATIESGVLQDLKNASGAKVGEVIWSVCNIKYDMIYPAGTYNIKVRWASKSYKKLKLQIVDMNGNVLKESDEKEYTDHWINWDQPAPTDEQYTLMDFGTYVFDQPARIYLASVSNDVGVDYITVTESVKVPARPYTTTVTNSGAPAVHAVSVNYTATETADSGKTMTLTVGGEEYTHTLPSITEGRDATEVFYVRLSSGTNNVVVAANDAFTVTGITSESKAEATYQAETDATMVSGERKPNASNCTYIWNNVKLKYNMVYPAGTYNIKVNGASVYASKVKVKILALDGNVLLESAPKDLGYINAMRLPDEGEFALVDFGTFVLEQPALIYIERVDSNPVGIDWITVIDVTE